MQRSRDIGKIVKILEKRIPVGLFGKRNKSPFEVLIATVLSQRTRDENTAKAAEQLFSKYKTPKEIADAGILQIEKLIKPSGFYKVKAQRIKEISRIIAEQYNSRVPKSLDELLKLPGVGRKTAGIVMCYGFGIAESIPVDTHVHRISNRLGLVKTKHPEQTEQALMKIVPKRYWLDLNELFVRFGQLICRPITPHCAECPITKYCNYYAQGYLKQLC